MKTTQGTPRKTNTKNAVGHMLSSLSNSKEHSSSDDATFTLVTYSRNSSSTLRAATEKKTANTNDDTETEMKMTNVTMWKFKEFQQQIFPVIQAITNQTAVKNHPFTQKWVKALKTPYNINESSTFRMVSKAFSLDDIKDYRKFLQMAPDIDKYILFEDNKKTGNGFLFKLLTPPVLHDKPENTAAVMDSEEKFDTAVIVDDATNLKSATDPGGDESITTNVTHYKICYGNPTDFNEMLQELWPYILQFIADNPEHNHSKQWIKWIKNGLHDKCDLSTLKEITDIGTLDQLYLVLCDSPAITTHFEVLWNHKIMYKRIPPNTPAQQPDSTLMSPANIHNVRLVADHDIEFCILHKAVYEEITKWMKTKVTNGKTQTEDPQSAKWLQRQKWLFAGLKSIQMAQTIRKIMEVNDIHEYLQTVQPYPPFQENFIIYDSEDPSSIRYSYLGYDNKIPPTVSDYQHFSALFDINIHQMSARLHEFNVKIAGCEYTLKNHFVQQKSQLQEITANIVLESTTTFKQQMDQIIAEKLKYLKTI
jgi:hypothetical protein